MLLGREKIIFLINKFKQNENHIGKIKRKTFKK